MKVLVIYRPNSEHATNTESFVRDFLSRNPQIQVNTIDVDSRAGSDLASMYDIVDYPGIVITRDDGTVQNIWQGSALPMIDEVAAYARV